MCEIPSPIPDLDAALLRLLRQVPAGRVTTYGLLAEALGNRVAARWVGQFLRQHEHDAACPCHRVVRAGGILASSEALPLAKKARRLAAEGVEIEGGRVDLKRFGFSQFVSDRPLETLREIQQAVARQVSLEPPRSVPTVVGGVDLSYPSQDEAVAAYTLVEVESGQLLWSTTMAHPVTFPYIVSYLTFREVPILTALLDAVRSAGKLADMVLVDGSGILHPRHVGSASHLGVVASVATIGVTKNLLVGQVDLDDMAPGESRAVIHRGQTIGVALRSSARSRRPIFISPGHRVNLPLAEDLVRRLLRGRRLPEPLYWADRLSRSAGKGDSNGY
jgi:deoxyribonuclease V